MQDDYVFRESIDAGSPRRRFSVSPRKPSLTPSLLSSGSRGRFASPKFGGTPGSSFRRESGISMFQEVSQIQHQLSEVSLGDRDRELANMKEGVKKHLDMQTSIDKFIEKQERTFSQNSILTAKGEANC